MENKKPTELKFKFKNKEVTKPTQKHQMNVKIGNIELKLNI